MELLFYTTAQCHLCELAEALLVSTPMPEPIPARLEPAASANSEAILTENAPQEHMVLQE